MTNKMEKTNEYSNYLKFAIVTKEILILQKLNQEGQDENNT